LNQHLLNYFLTQEKEPGKKEVVYNIKNREAKDWKSGAPFYIFIFFIF